MKQVLSLVLFLTTCSLMAQLEMTGVVKDSLGTPLELANIIALNQKTNALRSYAVTNKSGEYL